ncbi:MAG TPA: hypothetical protein ENL27_02540 [Candidatus Parcubacteria bacterium]|nr:hypothetical protein [Candidatus Parcubacteria bacterium]
MPGFFWRQSSSLCLKLPESKLIYLKIILISLFIFWQIYLIFLAKHPTRDIEVYPNTNPSPSIIKGVTLGQTFVPTRDGLSQIEVMMGTYDRENNKDIEFSLWSLAPQKKLLRKIKFNASTVKNNLFHKFSFPPVRQSKEKKFCFQLSSPGSTPENSICVWLNRKNIYPQGEFLYNEHQQPADVVFRSYAQRPIIAELRTIISKNRGIMGQLWFFVTILVIFEVLQVAVFILLLNWLFKLFGKKEPQTDEN